MYGTCSIKAFKISKTRNNLNDCSLRSFRKELFLIVLDDLPFRKKVLQLNSSPIIIACDHGGYALKLKLLSILTEKGIPYKDIGCHSEDIVRYPIYASAVAKQVSDGSFERGILICSTGIGMSIVANRYPNVRASVVSDHFTAVATREHNDSNVLCLGGRIIGEFTMRDILEAWLENNYIGGRHEISLNMLKEIDKNKDTVLMEQ